MNTIERVPGLPVALHDPVHQEQEHALEKLQLAKEVNNKEGEKGTYLRTHLVKTMMKAEEKRKVAERIGTGSQTYVECMSARKTKEKERRL